MRITLKFAYLFFLLLSVEAHSQKLECQQLITTSCQTSIITVEDTINFLKSVDAETYSTLNVESIRNLKRISILNGKIEDEDFIYLIPLLDFGVEVLDFRFNRLTGEGLSLLFDGSRSWDSVISVDLGGNPLVDRFLVNLKYFPNIEHLNIDFHDEESISQVTGEFFKSLSLKNLKIFWACNANIKSDYAPIILGWDALEGFNFHGSPVDENTLHTLRSVKIDFGQRAWDLRRLHYEIKKPVKPLFSVDPEDLVEDLDFALEKQLVTTETYEYAKANSNVFGLIVSRGGRDRYYIYGIYKY